MFWDSSAVVPLLLPERRSRKMSTLFGSDPEAGIWWGSPVECQSAIYRHHRESPMPNSLLRKALSRLRALADGVDVVAPTSELRDRAGRLLAAYPLRAADALQLAAGLAWCGEKPEGEGFVCLDNRLREAALQQGFRVLP